MHEHSFEDEVGQSLRKIFPWCVLSHVRLFDPSVIETEDPYGIEIDHLVHFRIDDRDFLLVVECKAQQVGFAGSPALPTALQDWVVRYPGGPKSGKQQLYRHAVALRSFFGDKGEAITIIGFLVSGAPSTPTLKDVQSRGSNKLRFILGNDVGLFDFCMKSIRPDRATPIERSQFLSLLHSGSPDPDIGHPTPQFALSYLRHSRARIDQSLFRLFSPTKRYWAINGSAGMGKSLLLIYAAFALSSDFRIKCDDEELSLATVKGTKQGLPPLIDRRVVVYAMTDHQLAVLRRFWDDLIAFVQTIRGGSRARVSWPAFRVWDNPDEPLGNVVLIDEAHDLDDHAQSKLAAWLNSENKARYLVVACDRHQKLSVRGADQGIIKGLNFSGHTRRLWRNYRNPFPVFAASVGLMFRWFCNKGPKVIPSKRDLEEGLGLRVIAGSLDSNFELACRNDAHPANAWANTVMCMPTVTVALSWLEQAQLKREDVLWVHFSEYGDAPSEILAKVSCYYQMLRENASAVINQYIKGREFPVVVIQGFWPDSIDGNDGEHALWIARRQLFLCASRATAFLLLVPPQGTSELTTEFNEVTRSLTAPDYKDFSQRWRFGITAGEDRRRYSVFVDADDSEGEKEELETITAPNRTWTAPSKVGTKFGQLAELNVAQFAEYLAITPIDLISELLAFKVTADVGDPVPQDLLIQICAAREVPLPLQREGD